MALIIAPLPVTSAVSAIQSAPAADACCGCCPVAVATHETTSEPACCSSGNQRSTGEQGTDKPASSEPCGSDCGQCPCCAIVVPAPLAILAQADQTLMSADVAAVVTASDLFSSRSDEPLLPPPQG
jgi:hypothetical protein